MPTQSPLQLVNSKYGDKAKLIASVAALLEPADGESADDFKARLKLVPNRKLLHLVEVGEQAKKLGGRDGLIKRIAELKGLTKDANFKDKLATFSLGKLVDTCKSLERRSAGKAGKATPRHVRKQQKHFR